MLDIRCFVHEQYTSNTYLLTHSLVVEEVYLIDIGNAQAVLEALAPEQKIKGIFLTHAHYDHMYGINDVIRKFPDCVIYCSEYAKLGLFSEKLNLSFYHENPVVFEGNGYSILSDGLTFTLYPDYQLEVLETQGHNQGSLSFKIESGIFTGDSLIPGVHVVTKLKSGNKTDAIDSINKIRAVSSPEDYIFPGHGGICKASEINWNFYLQHDRN